MTYGGALRNSEVVGVNSGGRGGGGSQRGEKDVGVELHIGVCGGV
jgi:hypothetical protein